MDPKEIRELIELISRSSFAEFELEGKGFKLRLVKQAPLLPGPVAVDAGGAPATVAAPTAPAPEERIRPAAAAPIANGSVELRSPIVGTFYRAPSPDAPPFVEVGHRVKKGQVVCIVEAMKVMNEIESEIDAEVLEVSVTSGQPVEYGEVLFRLRPVN